MIFEQKYKIGVEEIGVDSLLNNRGVLSLLEDIACLHAQTVGFGILNVAEKGVAWILLEWKVSILKRPLYNTIVTVKTWVSHADKLICERDFEITSENGEVLVLASSKWVLMDMKSRKMVKLTEDYIDIFEMEEGKKSFPKEEEKQKFVEPTLYTQSVEYKVQRRDIDMNGHLHNLNYLYIAYEILPEEVFQNMTFNQMIIQYKKEIKYGDKVICHYAKRNNEHVITFKVDDKLHAVVILKEDDENLD